MRTVLAVAVLVLAAPTAHAERSATFNLGGMIGGVEHRVDEITQMQPAGGPRLTPEQFMQMEHAAVRAQGCSQEIFEHYLKDQRLHRKVVLTTPNREYNVKWETLAAGSFRHPDHRFEWTRPEFQDWAKGVAGNFDVDRRETAAGGE